jgi:hypothetical protein
MNEQWDYTDDVGDFFRDSRGSSYLLRKVEQSPLFTMGRIWSPDSTSVLHDKIWGGYIVRDGRHALAQAGRLIWTFIISFYRLLASFGLRERAKYGVEQGSAWPMGLINNPPSRLWRPIARKCPETLPRYHNICTAQSRVMY